MSEDFKIPKCPNCKKDMRGNGQSEGRQRWRCIKSKKRGSCGHGSFMESALKPGRPPEGKEAKSDAQRQREKRQRDRLKKLSENT